METMVSITIDNKMVIRVVLNGFTYLQISEQDL